MKNKVIYPLFMEKYSKNIFFWVEKVIDEYLLRYEKKVNISHKIFNRLKEIAVKGKCVRGNLFCAGLEMFGGATDEKAYKISAALEIIQTSLLIHDDIMDCDNERRGRSSYHIQFAQDIEKQFLSDSYQYGISMGIGAGDIGFFMAIQTILDSGYDYDKLIKMVSYCSQEIVTVGVGQGIDVSLPYMKTAEENDILIAYKYKTGRYSIFMPLYMAHIICGRQEDHLPMEKWAEEVGILYQLRDDYLNLFGDPAVSGKPKGSDILKKKRTWWQVKLMKILNIKNQNKLREIYSKPILNNKDVDYIYEFIRKYKIKQELELSIEKYRKNSERLLNTLPLNARYLKYLKEFTIFVSERNS